jgi:hypothetical protein
VNSKQISTYRLLFENPIRSDISWQDIENLFIALGAVVSEGRGSRVRVELNGLRAEFHRPHPATTTDKGAVRAVREFLERAGTKNGQLI